MGLRTIDAPGVEIKEIDKSGYAPAMTGTKCFVMGYANKGEPYFPMQFTSKAAWQLYYGEPDNEAERYFYNACSEVINQNGVLYCSRIPYDNKAYGKMVGFKYKVGTDTVDIPKAADYIKRDDIKKVIYHNGNYEHDSIQFVIDNNIKRNVDYIVSNDIEEDTEYKNFFNAAFKKFSDKYGSEVSALQRYSVEYYSLDTSKPYLSCCFFNEYTANQWIEENKPEDVEGKVKYTSGTFARGDGDYRAMIFKYDYKVKVVDNEVIEAIMSGDNWTELDEEYKTRYNNALTSLTCLVDDEIVEKETEIFTSYLNACPDHTFIASTAQGEVACKAKQFDWIKVDTTGYNNEKFANMAVSALYETYLKDSEEYSKEAYEELYKPYLSQNILQIAALSSYQETLADGTKKNVIVHFDPYLSAFCDYDNFKSTIKVADLYNSYGCIKSDVKKSLPYYQVREADNSITKYVEITHSAEPIAEELTCVDEYRTGESKVPSQTFWVFDKTCARYQKVMEDDRKGNKRELLGIFPVVTTAANALYAQNLITVDDEDVVDYESVKSTITKDPTDGTVGFSLRLTDLVKDFNNANTDFTQSAVQETVSREANNYFSTIAMNPEGTGFDSENLKKIGVVVFKAFMDASEGNLVNFTPVEAFCGSLDKDAKNSNTGATTFIDTLVNGQSNYIYLFSNCFGNKTLKKVLGDTGTFVIKPGVTGMLGFFEDETAEEMSLPSLLQGIDKCFKNVEDINERDIDIIPDAGLANIGQYLYTMKSLLGSVIPYDLDVLDDNDNPVIKNWKCQSTDDVSMWKTIQFKYDNFCKNVRKDCMFIADGPRPLVLQGQKKIVRPSKPTNTIDANILPYVKWATGLNTNYGAGYMDWFQVADEFTGDLFWCPPSIKAMGVYINTDINFEYWDAPAGLNRGVIAALDTAFSPTPKQAGAIYTKNWNYAINYPYDGIVLEGQKTFQVKPSAFDRVNVRRLFLRLERQTYKVARYFVYEGNTAYTRQRLIDTLDPIFYQAKVGGGVYDYKIICDESINTPNVIDNNELRVKIGIKPVKTAEFILIDFVALPTGGSFSEM